MPVDFDNPLYWRKRFRTETSFEWLTPSSTFINIITPYLDRLNPQTAEILHLGSGTSDLHNHLRKKGFLNVTNIDYEPLALERGQQLERKAFGDVQTKYLVADVTKLELAESDNKNKRQLVIDKSTSDAVSCSGDEAVVAMAEGIYKYLNHKDGIWLSMSYSDARFTIPRIRDLFEVEVVGKVLAGGKKRLESDPDIWHWCYLLRPRRK
ncbi:hypothetical protein QBC43DRAFT_304025 [Cladorrhinum sp. PSN259]|nr:hypothetical protein QBC43DRAFT_304025 [Cladorrhinum sp. PSN259]